MSSTLYFAYGTHCVRDDIAEVSLYLEARSDHECVFVTLFGFIENLFMILRFYFTPVSLQNLVLFSRLSLSVFVCLVPVAGSTMRILLLIWLRNESLPREAEQEVLLTKDSLKVQTK